MIKISLNSIAPAVDVGHMTAFFVLKSYLVHKGIASDFDIRFNLFEHDRSLEEIANKVCGQDPDIASFSVQIWNYSKVRESCRRIKRLNPDVFVLLGGPYAGFMAETLMADGFTDLIVKGAGEDAFYHLMDRVRRGDQNYSDIPNLIYRKNGETIETEESPCFDLSRQYYPLTYDAEPLDHVAYETSRGCPFRCRFCSWSGSRGRAVTYYPMEKVERDLKALYGKPELQRLFIIDSDLFLDQKRGVEVLRRHNRLNRERKQKGLPEILLEIQLNPEYLNDETIDEIARLAPNDLYAGCGLQTVDEHVNNVHLGRKFNKARYIRNLKRLDDRLERGVGISTIYGLPGETYDGFRKTLDFLLTEVNNKKSHMLQCYRLRVLPGSYFWEHAEDYGLVFEEEPPHCLIRSDTFPEQDMEKAKRLVMMVTLFFTVLREVRRFVDKKIAKNRLDVYEKIIAYISENHQDFVSIFDELYQGNEETEFINALMRDYSLYSDHVATRQKIIRESRRIVEACAESDPAA